MSNTVWIAVETNKRSYWVQGGHQVTWLPGEKVVSIEVAEESCK
jgi:hypothetical protein